MALTSDQLANVWSLGAGALVGIEIPQSPVNNNIGIYGWRSIGVPTITISANAFGLAYVTAVNADANRATAEVLWIRQVKSNGTPTYNSGVIVRGSGAAGAENGYYCYVDEAAALLKVTKIVAGTLTSIATYAVTLPTTEEDYYIRFRANGTSLKARIWRYSAPEPSSWHIDTTDSAISAAGYIGLAFRCLTANNAGFHVPGFIAVATNGETAPRPRNDAELKNWINDDSNQRVILAEVGVLGQTDAAAAQASYALMSNWAFVTRGSDLPANQVYDDIIVEVPTLRAAANEQLVGRSSLSFGDLVVKNEDGVRDHWLAWNWDGRDCDLLMGGVGWRKWDFMRVLSGTVQEVYAPRRDQIGFKIRDNGTLLDRKIQTAVIGGSEADAGAPQPITFGKVFNIEPVLKDSSAKRYKFADGDLSGATGITDVRDKGVTVAYTADLTNGEFTLTNAPVGRITADVTNDSTGGSATKSGNTHRRAIQTIVEDRVGLGVGSCYLGARSGSLANFATTATIGRFIRSEENVRDVLDDIVISAGGFWYPNSQGLFCASQLSIPVSPYDHELLEDDLDGDLAIDEIWLPAEAEQLGYKKNWTVQADGLADGVGIANRALYRAEAQYTAIAPSYSGLDQPSNHALRRRPTIRVTLFYNSADAVTEATRLDAIYRKTCAIVSFTTKYNAPFYDLGQSVFLTHPKYGFENGRAGMIVGFEKNFASASARIRIFVQLDGQFPVTSAAVPIVSAGDFY